MKNRIIISAFFVSQFLFGCIAFIPPSHRETASTTVIIIHEPAPMPIENPVIEHPPITTPPHKPQTQSKERPAKQPDEKRERNSDRNTSERIRNTGERSGR